MRECAAAFWKVTSNRVGDHGSNSAHSAKHAPGLDSRRSLPRFILGFLIAKTPAGPACVTISTATLRLVVYRTDRRANQADAGTRMREFPAERVSFVRTLIGLDKDNNDKDNKEVLYGFLSRCEPLWRSADAGRQITAAS